MLFNLPSVESKRKKARENEEASSLQGPQSHKRLGSARAGKEEKKGRSLTEGWGRGRVMDSVRGASWEEQEQEAETKVTEDDERRLLKVPPVPPSHELTLPLKCVLNTNPLHDLVSDRKTEH